MTTPSGRIRGKVAAILNPRELALNIGSDHGVTIGKRFAVLNRRGIDIRDPESHEVIGSVEVMKVPVEAVRVQPSVTVARTFRTTRRNLGGRGFSPIDIFQAPRWTDVPETIRVHDKPDEAELDESESYVKAGDPVVEIVGDEFLTDLPDTVTGRALPSGSEG